MDNGTADDRAARLCGRARSQRFAGRITRRNPPAGPGFASKPFGPLSFVRGAAIGLCGGLLLLIPAAVFGQTNYYAANGTEYAIAGPLPADQVLPDVALNANGGFLVWQDYATDGSGFGVSAQRVDDTLSGTLSTFRVNAQGTNDQENARVALLKNGGAVFVWQGGVEGVNQHIYARFLNSSNVFLTSTDILVNTFTRNYQINPAVAVLNNSNVVVVWSSFYEVSSNSMQDVYGQIFSQTGQKIGGEFLINQFTSYNQRNPAVAALAGGGFVVAWVSEQERAAAPNWGNNTISSTAGALPRPSADIYARLYRSNGVPATNGAGTTNEFLVNVDFNPCAAPAVAAGSDGGFMVAWGARDMVTADNSWDIYARSYSSAGAGGTPVRVNTHVYGDQYVPRISSIGADYLVVWTSLGQDGSREGVFGQFLHGNGALIGGEFRVNTTTVNSQMQPALASDGGNQFLVVWTSFTGLQDGFDLYAQRYVNVAAALQPMSAPFVWAPFALSGGVYQPQLTVAWPALLGISVSNYEVYVDGAATPAGVTASNIWTMTAANGLQTNATHSFTVDYVTTDGYRSPVSPSASGTTWSGLSWGGIPYEWMASFYGGYLNGTYHTNNWPPPDSTVAAGGPTLLNVFLSGGNPYEPASWLQTAVVQTPQGMFLHWNTQPGRTYQVLAKTSLTGAWSNLGAPRFAAGTNDSIYVGGGPAGYYRVMLER